MYGKPLICDVEMDVLGIRCHVEVYDQGNGRCFALTRFGDHDAVISDGEDLKDALRRHTCALPMAVSCRGSRLGLPVARVVQKRPVRR